MTIGSGIAIAAIWIFASCCAASRYVTGIGMWLGIGAALLGTYFVVGAH